MRQPEHAYRPEVKAGNAAIDAEVSASCQRADKAHDAWRAEWDTCERYCKEQRALLRELEDPAALERARHASQPRYHCVSPLQPCAGSSGSRSAKAHTHHAT